MLISSSLSGIIKLIVIHAIHIWVCLCQRLSVSQQLREISLKKGGGQRIRVHLWIKLINHYWHWDKFKRGALKCTPLKWTLHLGMGDIVSISNFSPNFPDNAAHNWSSTALFKKKKKKAKKNKTCIRHKVFLCGGVSELFWGLHQNTHALLQSPSVPPRCWTSTLFGTTPVYYLYELVVSNKCVEQGKMVEDHKKIVPSSSKIRFVVEK